MRSDFEGIEHLVRTSAVLPMNGCLYVNPNDGLIGLRSSTIIVIYKMTGKDGYVGSAYDEG